jgi:hypothetical protein
MAASVAVAQLAAKALLESAPVGGWGAGDNYPHLTDRAGREIVAGNSSATSGQNLNII